MRALPYVLRTAALSMLAFSVLAVSGQSVGAQTPEHDKVRGVVTRLFDAMRTRDTAAMRATFDSTAVLRSVGVRGVRADEVNAWIGSVATAPTGTVLDERLGEQRVELDGPLATVWVRYHFYVGERFSHCGVDAFILARRGEEWRIIAVADTRQREGCAPLS